MTAFDRALVALDEQAHRTVEHVVRDGADALSADDRHFWSRVRRICGEEYVGAELADLQRECNRIRDIEIARGKMGHSFHDMNRHIAALQLSAAVSERIARGIQTERYGRSYV